MRRYLFYFIFPFILLVLASGTMTSCGGGKKNADYKKWKSKAKGYVKNPMALKAKEEGFQKEIENLTRELNECRKKNAECQSELDKLSDKCDREMRALRNRVDSLKNEYGRLNTAYESTKTTTTRPELQPGLFYRVQVGAYQKFDMNRHLNTDDNFVGESVDNMNKYLMGRFKNFKMAEAFCADIKKLGIKDAWVVAFNDGKRIPIKEAQKLQEQGK